MLYILLIIAVFNIISTLNHCAIDTTILNITITLSSGFRLLVGIFDKAFLAAFPNLFYIKNMVNFKLGKIMENLL